MSSMLRVVSCECACRTYYDMCMYGMCRSTCGVFQTHYLLRRTGVVGDVAPLEEAAEMDSERGDQLWSFFEICELHKYVI